MDVRITSTVTMFFGCCLIGACANQNSIFRVADTDKDKTETILIDAKQRPITVNTVTDNKKPMTCLARSADALSQAAASGNLKITQASGGSGELGFGDTEQVTSIAFRTQVTEAQQEFLYYLCQLRSNSVLTNAEVSSNLTHFQNTMLAMVAIDDLASSVRAKSPAADTQKTPPATDPKADAVKKAQSDADAAKKAVTTAATKVDADAKAVKAVTAVAGLKAPTDALTASLKTYDTKQKSYSTALGKVSAAIKAAKGDDSAIPDDVTAGTSDAADASKAVKSAYTKTTTAVAALAKVTDASKLDSAQSDVTKTITDYQASVKKSQAAEGTLQTALTAWNKASTDDTGKDAKSAKTAPSADGAAEPNASVAVANDVAIIVQTIVWQSFITEQCQKAMFENFKTTEDPVKQFCLWHLVKADEIREKQLLGSMVAGPGPRPPPPQYVAAPAIPAAPPGLFSTLNEQALEQALENAMKKNEEKKAAPDVPPK
jgi:hypothetical protein